MEARRILVLVDGIHSDELLADVQGVLRPAEAELILVYVVGEASRASLEMVRHRPGGLKIPPRLAHSLSEAELARAGDALEEAQRLARPLAARVRTEVVAGEAGHAMVELAARERATAVALRGTRGELGPIGRFIAGHAACSVVVLR